LISLAIPLDEIIIPFLAVGLAEMGDKTQLSVILLSSRTKEYPQLLAGVMLAFLITDGMAIFLGSWATEIVPIYLVKLISGSIFILFGISALRTEQKEEEKTQIASALFATEYDPIPVLIGVMAALFALSTMAIYLGRMISARVKRRLISRAAGILFMTIGLAICLSLLLP